MARKTKKHLTWQYGGGFKDRAGNLYTEEQAREMLRTGEAKLARWKHAPREPKKQGKTGRPKGSKSLKRTKNGFRNQYGIEFTEKERRDLRNSITRSNRWIDKQRAAEGQLDLYVGGINKGVKKSQLQLMGQESDFIISQQKGTLQEFRTKKEYREYMKKQKLIQSGRYLEFKTRAYKENHQAAIKNVFGDAGKGLAMRIRMMKPEQYRRMIQSDELADIQFVYDEIDAQSKLETLHALLDKWEEIFAKEARQS